MLDNFININKDNDPDGVQTIREFIESDYYKIKYALYHGLPLHVDKVKTELSFWHSQSPVTTLVPVVDIPTLRDDNRGLIERILIMQVSYEIDYAGSCNVIVDFQFDLNYMWECDIRAYKTNEDGAKLGNLFLLNTDRNTPYYDAVKNETEEDYFFRNFGVERHKRTSPFGYRSMYHMVKDMVKTRSLPTEVETFNLYKNRFYFPISYIDHMTSFRSRAEGFARNAVMDDIINNLLVKYLEHEAGICFRSIVRICNFHDQQGDNSRRFQW
tara:strand:- start:1090 stop:1899 length:810 start_codon:yes stop_codon:yes gene_type:complete